MQAVCEWDVPPCYYADAVLLMVSVDVERHGSGPPGATTE